MDSAVFLLLVALLGREGDLVGDRACGRARRIVDHDGRGLAALEVEVVAVVEPGGAGGQGQHEGDPDGGDAELGSLLGEALAEEQDAHEGEGRQQGDQPGVLEEPVGLGGDRRRTGGRFGCEHLCCHDLCCHDLCCNDGEHGVSPS